MSVYENEEFLPDWVEKYYKGLERKFSVNGIEINFYKSLRGYFRHSIILTDIKEREFGLPDYKMWERILTNVKSSRNPSESGGLFLKYDHYKDILSERSYYSSKKKFLELELLIKTPFKNYYLLNPVYIVKLYSPND